MLNEELSHEEESHLLNLSCIPLLVFFPLLGVYFVYLMQKDLLKSAFDVLLYIGFALVVAMPMTVFLSFEVLYSRKIRKPLRFHLKRLIGRMTIIGVGALLFSLTLGVLLATLSALMSERNTFLLSFATWALLWTAVVIKLRQEFTKLYKGMW